MPLTCAENGAARAGNHPVLTAAARILAEVLDRAVDRGIGRVHTVALGSSRLVSSRLVPPS